MHFGILGPLEVADGSRAVIPGRRQRALLVLLLLHRNEVVASDRLLEELWAGQASAWSQNALQAAVSRLRRALQAERLETRPPGYVLRLEPGELDAERFERLLAEGRAALAGDDADEAAELLGSALSLWRGPALADFIYEPFAQTEIARLEELRLQAREERIEAELALGRHAELVAELDPLVEEHPLRERPRALLMLALYRSGRQADALEVYRAKRTLLLEELGLEPGPELRELERRILVQDQSLDAPTSSRRLRTRTRPPLSARPETRRTVTVMCCGLAGSPALTELLDPEALRDVLGRYEAAASETVAAHGGTVEPFIGDALVAVFGVPTLHEDDALRAVRAAVELRARVGELGSAVADGLRARIGIETGEVIAGEARVAGAAVATAARLEQAAAPGEILLDEATRRLVGAAVRVEPAGGPALKETREAEPAWKLLALVPEAPPFAARPLETPLIGRKVELAQLQQSFRRAVRERTPYLLTMLGPPGIGKTRLARELADGVAREATVLVGRCLSYGQGIIFWPLRELLQQLPAGEHRTRLSALLGAGTSEEIFLAARRLLESVARERPLLLVLEDLHWADLTFLDFIEHLARHPTDAPVLILCLARGELLEMRESWGDGMENASSLRLEPLAEPESDALLDALGTRLDVRERVKEAAEGNPLFLEQMLAWLNESGEGEHDRSLPPTIQAVLAARLDRLGPGEAAVLFRAAVIGRDFDLDAVRELLPPEARGSAPRHLDVLVRKELLRPRPSESASDARFRFGHALVHDAAYRMVPKRLRAELHEHFADWLECVSGHRVGNRDEILGYHLEQAHRWLAELGPTERSQKLAEKAAERLARAGRQAFARGDMPAAANLLERAATLLRPDDGRRLGLLPSLGRALMERGQPERAKAVLSEAIQLADAAGERGVAADAAVARAFVRLHTDAQITHSKVRPELEEAIRVFDELDDLGGLARARGLVGILRLWDGEAGTAAAELEEAARYAHAAGDHAQEVENLRFTALALLHGPIPVMSALKRIEDVARRARDDRRLEMTILQARAHLTAMQGRFDEARELIAEAQSAAHELGLETDLAARVLRSAGEIELLAGDAHAAERVLRAAYEALERMGAWTHLPSVVPGFADALYAQGRGREAAPAIELAACWTVAEDVEAQIGLRRVRAKLLARQGDLESAECHAREATGLAMRTDLVEHQGKAVADLAEVLRLADRRDEAREALGEAARLFEQKGNVAAAESGRALLAAPAVEV